MNFKTLVPAVGLSALTLAGCGKAAQKAAPEMKKATTEFVQKADSFVNTKAAADAMEKLTQHTKQVNLADFAQTVGNMRKNAYKKAANDVINTINRMDNSEIKNYLSAISDRINFNNVLDSIKNMK